MSAKCKVAFICVHNSCRSQIAEALGQYFAGDVFENYDLPLTHQDLQQLPAKDLKAGFVLRTITDLERIADHEDIAEMTISLVKLRN